MKQVGGWDFDSGADRFTWSDAARQLLGLSSSESPSTFQAFLELIYPDDRHVFERAFADSRSVGRDAGSVEHRIVRGDDGQTRVMRSTWTHVPAASGQAARLVGVIEDITERGRADEEARDANRFLRTLIANLPGFVYRCKNDRDWTMLFLGGRVEEVTGYSPEDLIGNRKLSFADLITEEFREPIWNLWQETLQRREPVHSEYTIRARDGSIRWVWEQGRGVFDDQGELQALEGFICDITDRKSAEDALRLTQYSIDHAAIGIFRIRPDGTIEAANNQACQSLGYTHAELCQLTVFDIDVSFDRERWLAHRQIVRDRGSRTVQGVHRRKDGTTFPVEVTVNLVDFEGHDATISFARDISERVRADKTLKESTARLRLALQASRMGTWEWDLAADQVTWSPETLSIFGVSAADFGGHYQAYLDFAAPEARADVKATIEQFLSNAEASAVINYEHEIVRGDGKRGWIEVRGSVFVDQHGEPNRMTGVCVDITARKAAEAERRALEAQLRQSQKLEAVGQLAGGVAHDFNNILTAILGNVELGMDSVRNELGAEHSIVHSMAQIEQAAQRASALTRQLLAFSRRDVTQPQALNLNDTLASLDKMLRRLISENIVLELKPDPELRAVWADPGRLEQVIVNLTVNAVQAMPNGGRLTLTTQNVSLGENQEHGYAEARPDAHVLLAVSDTGHGMDATTRERVFEPFFTTKPTDKGTGLGLATVHGIVEQSGGHVTVDSEPGHGATFSVYLPAIEQSPTEKLPSRPTDPPGGDETILLCEDDDPVRELIALALRTAGYRLIAARRAEEALALAAAHAGPIELLITDVIMPGINGRALCEKLTALRPNLQTLFISGYTSNVVAQHGVLDEDVAFLEKPFTRRELLNKVRAVLGKTNAGF